MIIFWSKSSSWSSVDQWPVTRMNIGKSFFYCSRILNKPEVPNRRLSKRNSIPGWHFPVKSCLAYYCIVGRRSLIDKDKDKSTKYCLKIKISLKAYLPWDVEVSKPWIFPLVVVTTSSELIFAAAWSDYLDDQSEIINLRIISMIAIRWSGSNISVAASLGLRVICGI